MEYDYYEVLGVHPTADKETIQKAYRKRALECHPDRGGTHEEMVRVGLAWEVLSNPESRRQYDEARADPGNRAAQEAAAAPSRQARAKADQYPRRWPDFEAWLNTFARNSERYRAVAQEAGAMLIRLGKRVLEEGREISIATLTQTLRLVRYGNTLWRKQTLSQGRDLGDGSSAPSKPADSANSSGFHVPVYTIFLILFGSLWELKLVGCLPEGFRIPHFDANPESRIAKEIEMATPIQVSAKALVQEYHANEIRANQKYYDKVLEITGTATQIRDGGKGFWAGAPCATVDGVECVFKATNQLEPVSTGQQLTIRGKCKGRNRLEYCTLRAKN
jgi:curved DNA-binding protein CbpA